MKKLLLIAGMVVFAGSLSAASLSTVVTNAAMTNCLAGYSQNGGATVSQITLAAGAGDVTVKLIDTATPYLKWTNTSYTTITTLVTNQITSWTNFFGSVNYMTNVALTYRTNTVAAATNTYPVVLTLTASTNQTVIYDNVDYNFVRGIYATNSGTTTATLNLTFSQ